MPNTYTFSFPAFDCYPQHEGERDVVFTVHWRRSSADEAGHTASVYGTVGVSYAAGEPFVAFESLTPEIVTGWVEAALGTETLTAQVAALDAQIAEQVAPSQVTKPAPWTEVV